MSKTAKQIQEELKEYLASKSEKALKQSDNHLIANNIQKKTLNWKKKQKEGQQKRAESDWTKKMIGNKNGVGNQNRKGMKNSEESNAKRSQTLIGIERLNLRGIPKPKVICPHCGKEGGRPQMIQFHFDNCKLKA